MEKEKTLLNAVLVFPIDKKLKKVLLALKSRKIGAGCWNGYGGGIKKNEHPKKAAIRELREESGLVVSPRNLSKAAVIDFKNTKKDGLKFICKVHVYLAHSWSGKIQETNEMSKPTWFDISKLPINQMMPSDRKWLPMILSGKKIIATASYGPFQKNLLGRVSIREIKEI